MPGSKSIDGVSAVDIAGPGFLNITVDAAAAGALAKAIVEAGPDYGTNTALAGHTVNMEFVSANPTGPLHIGHTRWAALGDAIARVLRASGANVTAEYYINDAGSQMNVFAHSVLSRLHGRGVPEGGYPGEYIADLGHEVLTQHPDIRELTDVAALPVIRGAAYKAQLHDIKRTLAEFGVEFDVYFSEQELHDAGAIEDAVARLREQGHVYDDGGAVWLRTTDFGDDKDRVMIRANGEPTYFAADAAYYLSKKDRGYTEKIYLLGADHHGQHQPAQGHRGRRRRRPGGQHRGPDRPAGLRPQRRQALQACRNIIGAHEDLISWLGKDAVRYSLARFPADSPLTLDPELLKKHSNEDPVIYVQYAHARSRGTARNAVAAGVGAVWTAGIAPRRPSWSTRPRTNCCPTWAATRHRGPGRRTARAAPRGPPP